MSKLVAIMAFGKSCVPRFGRIINRFWKLLFRVTDAKPRTAAPRGTKFASIRKNLTSFIDLAGLTKPYAWAPLTFEWKCILYVWKSLGVLSLVGKSGASV